MSARRTAGLALIMAVAWLDPLESSAAPVSFPRAPAFAAVYPGSYVDRSGWSNTRTGREGYYGFATRDRIAVVVRFYRDRASNYGLTSQPIPVGGRRPVFRAKGARGDVSIFSDRTTQNRLYIQVVWTELKRVRP